MKFTLDERDGHMVVTRRIAVENGITVGYPHSTAKVFRIEGIVVTFWYDTEKGWKVSTWPELHGTELKKDGTDSKNRRSASAYDWKSAPEFQWLRDLVDAVRPTDRVGLPTVT